MSPLLSAAQHPLAVWAGWTALVVLWHSLVMALALAAWRAARASAGPEVQHRAALVAFGLCAAGLVAAPVLLACWPTAVAAPATPVALALGATRQVAPAAGVIATTRFWLPAGSNGSFNAVAGGAGLLWALGACLLLTRLAGGWWMASRLRARAVVVNDPEVLDTVRRVSDEVAVAVPLTLLASPEIEAPVVIGARRPALIVPDDFRAQLGETALAPLIAHECAHVRRADYAVNVAQSAAEALLFFSPAVLWVSRVVRETREYCCDDVAVKCCGDDRSGYVRALTALAALGSRSRTQPVLGVAGPRLITRVRRLLREEAMARPAVVRFVACLFAIVVAVGMGRPMLGLSVAHVARAAAPQDAQTVTTPGVLPISWVSRQPGSSVILGPVVADATYAAASATLRNVADVAVTSVGVIAFVGGKDMTMPLAARLTRIEVLIEPGATETVALHLLDRAQLDDMKIAMGEPRHAFVGLTDVTYANGTEWKVTPNPAGRTMVEVFSLPPAEVARQLVGVKGVGTWLCYDQDRHAYSPGATVAVRDEPGRLVICRDGVWRDDATAAGPPVADGDAEDRVSIDLTDASLDDILRAVGSATGTTIVRARDVPNIHGLRARFHHARVEELLDVVLAAQGLTYRLVDRQTIVVQRRPQAPARAAASPGATVLPRALKQVRPEFRPALVEQGVQGTVLVTITVGTDGKVKDAVVKTPLSPALDDEALKAARQWEFKPATRDGVPVEVQTELEFTFTVK